MRLTSHRVRNLSSVPPPSTTRPRPVPSLQHSLTVAQLCGQGRRLFSTPFRSFVIVGNTNSLAPEAPNSHLVLDVTNSRHRPQFDTRMLEAQFDLVQLAM